MLTAQRSSGYACMPVLATWQLVHADTCAADNISTKAPVFD